MDYISISIATLALIASVVSLIFSLRNDKFNKKFKLDEARIEILSEISETMLLHSRCISVHRDLVATATRLSDPVLEKSTVNFQKNLDRFSSDLDKLFKIASEFTDSDVDSGYRNVLPSIRRLRDRMIQMQEEIASTHAAAARVVAGLASKA